MKNKVKIVAFLAAWQIIVFALSIGGIFVDIYNFLGIPWNVTGWKNICGTAIGLFVLEFPALLVLAYVFLRKRGCNQ